MNFKNNNFNSFSPMNSHSGNNQNGQGSFSGQSNYQFSNSNNNNNNQGSGFPNQNQQQGSGQGFPGQNFNGQGFPNQNAGQNNQNQGFPTQDTGQNSGQQGGYVDQGNQNYNGLPNQQGQQNQGYFEEQQPTNQQGYPYANGQGYSENTPVSNDKQKKKSKKGKNSAVEQDVFKDPNYSNSYRGLDQDSMEDYYDSRKSKRKLIAIVASGIIACIFVLGAFSTPFINGNPTTLSQEARMILSYSEDIKEKTQPLFEKDQEYYDFANNLANQTISSDIEKDTEISREIVKMENLIEELTQMDKLKQVPAGFEGDAGNHQKMIGLLEKRKQLLNDIRQISQGQRGKIKEFNDNFIIYVNLRNLVIDGYNKKYEYNFRTGLYNTKELEFNVR